MLNMIVAVDNELGIGKGNSLPFHIPEDLKRFKKLTSGKTVIMGKNTWDSLPIKPLPDRDNIVVTSNPFKLNEENYFLDNFLAVTMEKAKTIARIVDDVFIIGGQTIYEQFIDLADRIYITHVLEHHHCDTFFPILNTNWERVAYDTGEEIDYNDHLYYFATYERKPKRMEICVL